MQAVRGADNGNLGARQKCKIITRCGSQSNFAAQPPPRLFLSRLGAATVMDQGVSVGDGNVRRAVYLLAIGLIALWTGYCLLDLVYVAIGYWSLAPWLGVVAMFSEPVVEPGFWGGYLKQLTVSWGSVVTGAGVIALLMHKPHWRPVMEADGAMETYPIIPEAERTEPRLLFIEEPRPPRDPTLEPQPGPVQRVAGPAPARPLLASEKEPRLDPVADAGDRRANAVRAAPIVRALRGRSSAATQARQADPGEEARTATEPRLFSGGAREEYSFFEVEFEDGTGTVERLRRAEYGGDDAAGIALVRRRVSERAATERQPAKPIAVVKPVSYFGFPHRR